MFVKFIKNVLKSKEITSNTNDHSKNGKFMRETSLCKLPGQVRPKENMLKSEMRFFLS